MHTSHSDSNQDEARQGPKNRPDLTLPIIALFAGFTAGGLFFMNHPTVAGTLRNFHAWFYNSALTTWGDSFWLGVSVQKTPLDLWIYQEIIYETHPDVLIEAGTAEGGSAYYFANLFDLMGRGRVITIDIGDSPERPKHNRITYLLGSSTAPAIVDKVKSLIAPGERVMVSLDSDHRKPHVAQELKIYSELVTRGCYLVVEDTNVNGHPVRPDFGPGPMEALREFISSDHRYVPDHAREKFGVTFFPDGWLRRVQ